MAGLGIDLHQFIYQLVNFLILLILLTWLLHKPLLKMLDDRTKEVSESVANSKKIREEMAATEERQKSILEEAQNNATELLKSAKDQASEMAKKIEANANERSLALADRTKNELAGEKAQMKEELRGELASLLVKAVKTVVGEQKIAVDQKKIEQVLKDL